MPLFRNNLIAPGRGGPPAPRRRASRSRLPGPRIINPNIVRTITASAVAACLSLSLGACAGATRTEVAPPAGVDPGPPLALPEDPPSDFTLAVTVFAPARSHQNAAVAPERRPSRYIIETDRVLRTALGPGAGPDTFPLRTRVLDSAQHRRLWEAIRGSSLGDTASPARVGAEQVYAALPGRVSYVVTVSALDERWTIAADESAPGPEAQDARLLVRELARLAWISR